MELNWQTFVLEIVNFLILVWILKRFLYKPVFAAIAQRKAAIDKTLSDARARQMDAAKLEEQYRNRLAEWDAEKVKLRACVREEIDAQREKMMAALQNSLAQEREKARVVEVRNIDAMRNRAGEEAISAGVEFTARLLARVASPELEAKLVDVALEDMSLLSADQLRGLRAAGAVDNHPVKVISAFPLPDARRDALTRQLEKVVGQKVATEFSEDGRLLAGLRVSAGPWMLRGNLQDELQFFSEAVNHGPRNQ